MALLAGCGNLEKTSIYPVKLAPNVSVSTTNIGNMSEVAFRVVDSRPGVASGGPDWISPEIATITSGYNLAAVVRNAVLPTVKSYKFVPVPYQPKLTRKLTVEVTDLNYIEHPGDIYSSYVIHAAVEANAINNMLTYSRVYEATVHEPHVLTPSNNDVTRSVNVALSQALDQMLGDQQLWQFLAR